MSKRQTANSCLIKGCVLVCLSSRVIIPVIPSFLLVVMFSCVGDPGSTVNATFSVVGEKTQDNNMRLGAGIDCVF